jgi:hypothetical protein
MIVFTSRNVNLFVTVNCFYENSLSSFVQLNFLSFMDYFCDNILNLKF